ncbi:hypothetical protein OS493_024195 [Desmophyllum pertusum]|uniref:Uncharacterized protein n=1 Tax=Desmophyllum pertusum TaxID=174260 RepID=A0A9W9ZB60_9CNID|nr:hypothetical protein OS493_024195 [Desmophyllum pertusum]
MGTSPVSMPQIIQSFGKSSLLSAKKNALSVKPNAQTITIAMELPLDRNNTVVPQRVDDCNVSLDAHNTQSVHDNHRAGHGKKAFQLQKMLFSVLPRDNVS